MSSTEWNDLGRLSQALTGLTEKAANAIVAVKAGAYRTVTGVGLGDGLIAIADHSLRREERVPVHAADGTQYKAAVVGRDPSIDLALLKADDLSLQKLEPASLDGLKAGSITAVVGLTSDVGPSVSLGILGARGGSRRTWKGGTLDAFLRLDVNLYPSQSGAAVIDTDGKLIGMATPGLLRHSAVAVPLATIDRIAQEVIRQGRIRHGYLGVGLQPVQLPASIQAKLSQEQKHGLILLNVESASPAEEGGLQVGDILLKLGDVTVTELDELQSALRGDAVGKPVKLLLVRGGDVMEMQLTVGERRIKN